MKNTQNTNVNKTKHTGTLETKRKKKKLSRYLPTNYSHKFSDEKILVRRMSSIMGRIQLFLHYFFLWEFCHFFQPCDHPTRYLIQVFKLSTKNKLFALFNRTGTGRKKQRRGEEYTNIILHVRCCFLLVNLKRLLS